MDTVSEEDVGLSSLFGLSPAERQSLYEEQAVFYSVLACLKDIVTLKDRTGRDRWIMVLRDFSDANCWRTQSFDINGFSGHAIFESRELAIESAIRSGFLHREDEALDRVQDLPSFMLGNFCCDQIAKFNAGEISYQQYLQSVSNYKVLHGMSKALALAA